MFNAIERELKETNQLLLTLLGEIRQTNKLVEQQNQLLARLVFVQETDAQPAVPPVTQLGRRLRGVRRDVDAAPERDAPWGVEPTSPWGDP